MSPTKREVTLRDDGDERVWVEWFNVSGRDGTVNILSEQDGEEVIMASFHPRELGQLLDALQDVSGPGLHSTYSMVRDLGDFERVWLEWSGTSLSLIVEQVAEIKRILVIDPDGIEKLIATIERAEDEFPRTEDDAHV